MQDRKKGKVGAVSEISETLSTIPKPGWRDMLPLVLVMFVYSSVMAVPQNMKMLYHVLKFEASTAIDKKYEKQRKIKAKEGWGICLFIRVVRCLILWSRGTRLINGESITIG